MFKPTADPIASPATSSKPTLKPSGGELCHTLQGHSLAVTAVAPTPDGKWVVSTSDDRTVKVWNLET
jgi:WD40 repeat protein